MNKRKGPEELKQTIDELNQLAWDFRVTDSNKAFLKSKEAIELSQEINYQKGLADGYRTQGFCSIRVSDFEKASDFLSRAGNIYESLKNLKGLATISEYFGIIERNKGNYSAALDFIFKALSYSQQTGFTESEITCLYQIGVTYRQLANYDKALEYLYESLSLAKSSRFTIIVAYNLNIIGSIYFETGDYTHALEFYQQGLVIRQQLGDKWGEAGSLDNIGFSYLKLKNYNLAIDFCKQSLEITKSTGDKKGESNTLLHLAEIYKQTNNKELATEFCNESLKIRNTSGDKRGEAEILLFLVDLSKNQSENNDRPKIAEWLSEAVKITEEIKAFDLLSKARYSLYEFYKQTRNFKDAISQLEIHINLEKDLHKNTINQKVLNLEISHKAEEAKKEADKIRLRNDELITLNEEISGQKIKLEQTLTELKATQSQLIQSEKMASLGELTAGIAHEIQNPLNFVNNFSEVSKELLDEMKTELDLGNTADAKEIANDVIQNLEKINHHGKRADAIVKGMLQHSRSSSGVKEPTDINALADEYIRLTYHGLRAKDKSFNVTIKTDFDASLEKINIVPQDIGRGILNLLTNAFYAVAEKKKQQPEGYEPTVKIKTTQNPLSGGRGAEVVISVTDNGNGIPQKVLDKIFQPFFTTKPTGQGTGLGLSLSYDIVKAHSGQIKVETKEDEGSEFIIILPI